MRAFYYARARSPFAPLCSIADESTADLMTRDALYRHLGTGDRKDDALRAAQFEDPCTGATASALDSSI